MEKIEKLERAIVVLKARLKETLKDNNRLGDDLEEVCEYFHRKLEGCLEVKDFILFRLFMLNENLSRERAEMEALASRLYFQSIKDEAKRQEVFGQKMVEKMLEGIPETRSL